MSQRAYFFGATQMILGTLGASVFPSLIRSPSGCVGGQMVLLGASGSTVQVLPNAVSGASVGGGTAITTLGGYPITTSQTFTWDGPAAFYLAATGATATVAINFKFGEGGCTLQ